MFDLKVHHIQTVMDEKTKQKVERLVKYTPYKMFQQGSEGSTATTIFLRDGQFHYESGELIENPPAWVIEQCEAMTDEGKKVYGYKSRKEPEKRGPGRPPKEAA